MNYSVLAKSYNTLHYSNQLKESLERFFSGTSFTGWEKSALHQVFNDALIKNYDGEEILKFKLAQLFKAKDYVAAFEVKVKNSRADFLVINGDTRCFEVKSKIDTLSRLGRQVDDYKDVFEYNTVVVDKKHLSSVQLIIPEYYGIWYFKGDRRCEYRKSQLSPCIDSQAQLSIMTKKELKDFFFETDFDVILTSFNKNEINQKTKDILKNRYNIRWNFVKRNWDDILPIDLQFFFNTNISPRIIYST